MTICTTQLYLRPVCSFCSLPIGENERHDATGLYVLLTDGRPPGNRRPTNAGLYGPYLSGTWLKMAEPEYCRASQLSLCWIIGTDVDGLDAVVAGVSAARKGSGGDAAGRNRCRRDPPGSGCLSRDGYRNAAITASALLADAYRANRQPAQGVAALAASSRHFRCQTQHHSSGVAPLFRSAFLVLPATAQRLRCLMPESWLHVQDQISSGRSRCLGMFRDLENCSGMTFVEAQPLPP